MRDLVEIWHPAARQVIEQTQILQAEAIATAVVNKLAGAFNGRSGK